MCFRKLLKLIIQNEIKRYRNLLLIMGQYRIDTPANVFLYIINGYDDAYFHVGLLFSNVAEALRTFD